MGSELAQTHPASPAPGAEDWGNRMRRAALDVERRRRAWRDALDDRDRLVVEAYDAHKPVREIARVAMVDKARVNQIVAEWSAAEGRPAVSSG